MSRKVNIKRYLSEKKSIVEKGLEALMLKADGPFTHHIEAMRYSLFVGGKRVRPILCLAAGEAITNDPETLDNLLPVACALECIHTYSLIHDDLPAMDDDDLRRGKPTNHTLFGEAGAILAGDGLLTLAFDLLSDPRYSAISAESRLRIIHAIAKAAGPLGMVGGQALDIANEKTEFPFQTLQTIHKSKTGALITGSVMAGAIGAGASAEQIEHLMHYGDKIGLAFQIVDDLLNVTSTTEQLGKAAGSDANRGKATYPAFFGVEQTRIKAEEAVAEAIEALRNFDEKADPLRDLAGYIYARSH
ncbi:MAG: farnesyl-diphosphate synthase [Desulfobulbaceae bacterium BRH_c16a]|nr:MAG: farnesyl-diphosphate synthase [Desulfobulbaceae bacterium BRH_c16a]